MTAELPSACSNTQLGNKPVMCSLSLVNLIEEFERD
ncbi:hypothetical protein LMCDFJHI_01666 [Aeromonas salmonicida]